ncbi:MAG TPA: hypothetical protein VHW09_27650 [Bryobacteraceae bacterium]|jgi:hypothetical protein|nr:hypothetical protein [Bryobacteraceae bacterium]
MTTTTVIVLVVAVIVVAAIAFYLFRQWRSQKLESHFGSEYERAVHDYGSRSKAEDALLNRQRRVQKIHLHPLDPEKHDAFAAQWHDSQLHFVDAPAEAIREADRLVYDVMLARGYPMSDFDRRAEDLSVDYPQVVRNYRSAHEIALLDQKGQASTEDLRNAMVFYRDLFDELIGTPVSGAKGVRL